MSPSTGNQVIQNDMCLLFQHMGEMLSGIRGLHDTIDIRQAQAEQLHDIVRSDLATLRRDQHDLEEKLDCMVYISQHQMEKLQSSCNENARAIGTLVASVDALKSPMLEILAFKSRVVGLLFAAGVIGSGTLWLVEPVYKWFVEYTLRRN